MSVYARMQDEGLTYRDLLRERGQLKTYNNNLPATLLFDKTDRELVGLIEKHLQKLAKFEVTKINILQQQDLMYNKSGRFISVLNRNPETGGGYQEYYGFREFKEEYEKYINEKEKMICLSTLYSKFPTSEGIIRTVRNANRTSIFVQDLDAGKKGMSLDEQLRRVAELVHKKVIEMPNLILFTGTGIQLFWLIDNLMMKEGTKVFSTWKGIQKTLFTALEEAGLEPDPVVFDPTHNTRLVETLNARANDHRVRGYVIHSTRFTLSHFINKYFSVLHDIYKKQPKTKSKPATKGFIKQREGTREEVEENQKKKVRKDPRFWTAHSYAWAMKEDMSLIAKYKAELGDSMQGYRWRMATIVRFNAIVFYGGDYEQAIKAVEEWWNGLAEFQKTDTSLQEIIRRSRTAQRYYEEMMDGTFNPKYKRGGLYYKAATLIKEFDIPLECQLMLNVIKSRVEKRVKDPETGKLKRVLNKEYERARKNKENREKGVKERSEYLQEVKEEAKNNETQLKVKELYLTGMKQVHIAELLGISKPRVSKIVKDLGLKKKTKKRTKKSK
ncbi:hypothetical protein [Priestia megaterium]|uniref:hypothetical protein n=1 Tax=Priestia megaterium TaxID=1404 RepID=UPI0012D8AEFC|nr:hypothetical protein [Priestia megaterium]MUL34746.1 hypothetical protein [Priestia megaterium]